MSDKEKFYISTAIPYVNGVPHLGHAYEAILTDVMARFKRLDGYDVMFLTGSDEYGEKNAKKAEEEGITPQEIADRNTAAFQEAIKVMNISNDDFIRTTEPRHHKGVQEMWKRLKEKGLIYLDKYAGWYSVREEAYFTEDELTEGDDGVKYTPLGTEVEWVEEESYFFKLSAYTDKLLEYYKENPSFIEPETRRNEIVAFVSQEGGLKDLSVSRHKNRLEWGVPVPDDENHVMYVWLDALTNYISALGFPDEQADKYATYWPANMHVIGKDITRFHTIYWPAFLMAADIPLPKTVFAHGFINVGGAKMSKSVGNVLSPHSLVETYGLDQIRYFLMREIPHGQDGNFTHESAITRINADLANGLGNLAQRTLSMIHKNCNAAFPQAGEFETADTELLDKTREALLPKMRTHAENMHFHRMLEEIWRVVADANAYIDEQAPWKLKKENPDRMGTVLYTLAETIRCIALAAQPVIPTGTAKMLDLLQVAGNERQFAHMSADYALKSGTTIDKPEGIFPRIVENEGEEAA